MSTESSNALGGQDDEQATSAPSPQILLPPFFAHGHTIDDIKPASIPGEPFYPGIFLHHGRHHLVWSLSSHDALLVPENRVCRLDGVPKHLGALPRQSDPAFTHDPLDYAKRQIRLLVLLPRLANGENDLMACHLVTVPLDDSPPFTALSYQWGDPSQWYTRPVLVNGKVLYIGENLWSALRRRQFDTQVEVMWADQLCIDQTKTPAAIQERNHQIPLMADIYSRARFVMGWLGPNEDVSGNGLEFLARADRLFNIHCWQMAYPDQSFELSCFLEMTRQPRFLRSPYWNRAWTFREMSASDHVVFYAGPVGSLHISRIVGALQVLEQVDDLLEGFESSLMRLPSLFSPDSAFGMGLGSAFGTISWGSPVQKCSTTWFNKRPGGPPSELYTLVPYGYEATDPRDHIYALLGMAEDREQLQIVPDYNKSVANVFAEFVLSYIKLGDLSLISCNTSDKKHANLPSWVPDWTPGSWVQGLFIREYWSKGQLPFFAGKEDSGQKDGLGFELLSDPAASGILSLRGVRLGSITDLSPAQSKSSVGWYHGWGPQGPRSGMPPGPPLHMRERGGVGARGATILSWFVDLCSRSPLYASYNLGGPLPGQVQEDIIQKGLTVCTAYRPSAANFPNWIMDRHTDQDMRISTVSLGCLLVREFDHLGKRFYASSDGRFGSGPGDIQVGDTVVIFSGSPVPYILRPAAGDAGNWRLVGWAYHFGVMLGEVYRQDNIVSLLEVFNLV
ncbi:heterokaryon incompatibility protein-domain-containing protein [Podospora conica]|nr:heterokaryon incompatibility protein-domain-containing protein [Schizothecium conicum]